MPNETDNEIFTQVLELSSGSMRAFESGLEMVGYGALYYKLAWRPPRPSVRPSTSDFDSQAFQNFQLVRVSHIVDRSDFPKCSRLKSYFSIFSLSSCSECKKQREVR